MPKALLLDLMVNDTECHQLSLVNAVRLKNNIGPLQLKALKLLYAVFCCLLYQIKLSNIKNFFSFKLRKFF